MSCPTSFTQVVGAFPFVVLHTNFTQIPSVQNVTSQFFLGYHSNHANASYFHPSVKCAPYCLWDPSQLSLLSQSCISHPLCFAFFIPFTCVSATCVFSMPSYTMKNNELLTSISEWILKAASQTLCSNIFCNTNQKALEPTLKEGQFEIYCELTREDAILLSFYFDSHWHHLRRKSLC